MKLGFLITIFTYVTICVATSNYETIESFSVEVVWRKCAQTYHKPDWLDPVQKYHDDVMAAFSTFPKQLDEAADDVKKTFEALLSKVVENSDSKSKILSSGTTEMLKAFAKINLNDHSAQGVINEFQRMLPILMKAFRKVVTSYKKFIGSELVYAVNDDISDLECKFKDYVKKFQKGDGEGGKIEVDYKPVMDSAQKLIKTISQKGDVKLSDSQLQDPDDQDVLIVLNLILDYIMVVVHGLGSSSEAVILVQKPRVKPRVLHVIVVSVGDFVGKITDSIVVNTAPGAVDVNAHLKTLVKCANKLKAILTNLFENVDKITQQLTKSLLNPFGLNSEP